MLAETCILTGRRGEEEKRDWSGRSARAWGVVVGWGVGEGGLRLDDGLVVGGVWSIWSSLLGVIEGI
jgi:hypothetical protein